MLVNSSPPTSAYMRQWFGLALVQVMVCRLVSAKPISKPMLGYYQFDENAPEDIVWNGSHIIQGEMS